tara:strand:+ start:519 stop:671 length:153 start_codon:yes stop_codon:yes gene_type:complete
MSLAKGMRFLAGKVDFVVDKASFLVQAFFLIFLSIHDELLRHDSSQVWNF